MSAPAMCGYLRVVETLECPSAALTVSGHGLLTFVCFLSAEEPSDPIVDMTPLCRSGNSLLAAATRGEKEERHENPQHTKHAQLDTAGGFAFYFDHTVGGMLVRRIAIGRSAICSRR